MMMMFDGLGSRHHQIIQISISTGLSPAAEIRCQQVGKDNSTGRFIQLH